MMTPWNVSLIELLRLDDHSVVSVVTEVSCGCATQAVPTWATRAVPRNSDPDSTVFSTRFEKAIPPYESFAD